MAWRLATSLDVLRKEVNAAWPNRKKQTDGTIGDPSHQSQGSSSDHNPWLNDTVRAWDITTDSFTDVLAEWLRKKGQAGDLRLRGGGYVIYKGRIASDRDNWIWRTYTGSDRHDSHIHLSVTREAAYDSPSPWGVGELLTNQPLPQPQEDDDMLIWNTAHTKGFLLAGGHCRIVDGEQAGALIKAGVPEKILPDSEIDKLLTL